MLFTGQAEITIDAKDRLSIPAKFRARWDPDRDGPTWYCVPWPQEGGGVLRLYPERRFEEIAGRSEETLTPNQDLADLETTFFGQAEQLDVDGSFRIRVPKWHRDLVGMPNEVVVIGARNRLEIRDRARWLRERETRFNDLKHLVDRIDHRGTGA